MLIEAAIVCLSHGLTSFIVHGIPTFSVTQEKLVIKNIILSKIKFTLAWICFYTIVTPISFYRLFQSTQKWVQIYSNVAIKSFDDEEL